MYIIKKSFRSLEDPNKEGRPWEDNLIVFKIYEDKLFRIFILQIVYRINVILIKFQYDFFALKFRKLR